MSSRSLVFLCAFSFLFLFLFLAPFAAFHSVKQPALDPLASEAALQGEMHASCVEALCLKRGTDLAVDLSLLALITSTGLFGRRGSVTCPPRIDGRAQ